jgi:hypothetical protein
VLVKCWILVNIEVCFSALTLVFGIAQGPRNLQICVIYATEVTNQRSEMLVNLAFVVKETVNTFGGLGTHIDYPESDFDGNWVNL